MSRKVCENTLEQAFFCSIFRAVAAEATAAADIKEVELCSCLWVTRNIPLRPMNIRLWKTFYNVNLGKQNTCSRELLGLWASCLHKVLGFTFLYNVSAKCSRLSDYPCLYFQLLDSSERIFYFSCYFSCKKHGKRDSYIASLSALKCFLFAVFEKCKIMRKE